MVGEGLIRIKRSAMKAIGFASQIGLWEARRLAVDLEACNAAFRGKM
jgi:hypothetical protein